MSGSKKRTAKTTLLPGCSSHVCSASPCDARRQKKKPPPEQQQNSRNCRSWSCPTKLSDSRKGSTLEIYLLLQHASGLNNSATRAARRPLPLSLSGSLSRRLSLTRSPSAADPPPPSPPSLLMTVSGFFLFFIFFPSLALEMFEMFSLPLSHSPRLFLHASQLARRKGGGGIIWRIC